MNNNQLPPGTPDWETRKRMVEGALKGSKFEQMIQNAQPKTPEERMQRELEEKTLRDFDACEDVVRAELATGQPVNQAARAHMVMALWKDELATEDKDTLHFMLCLVLTGALLDRLDEIC